jgi:hypothetical protein
VDGPATNVSASATKIRRPALSGVVVLFRLGDCCEPLPQVLRAGRGMQLAGIRLPSRNLGPHHVTFALGVGPGLDVIQSAEQITLALAGGLALLFRSAK